MVMTMSEQIVSTPLGGDSGAMRMQGSPVVTNQALEYSSEQQDDQVHHCMYPEFTKNALHEECIISRVRAPRSLSQDRRKNESEQYFEAVGESPPRSGHRNIEIVDTAGEESQDDDESTSEIHALIFPEKPPLPHSIPRRDLLRVPPFRMLDSNTAYRPQNIENSSAYRGIGENGLAITKRGVQRGNYMTLHRKAWLEVSDVKHRYGKNLRIYYRHWESMGCPTNHFFDWLDSKGDAIGQPLPDLAECPRRQLEADTVLYISDVEVTKRYALQVMSNHGDRRCRILGLDDQPVSTGKDGWIFVLRDNVLYASQKVAVVSPHSKQRFHHSSFFGGKAVSAAGIIVTDSDGFLTELFPHSGHYRPGEPDLQRCLCYIYARGVNLKTFNVDMQQVIHVARNKDAVVDGKKKKMNSLHLETASFAAHYLSHKAEWTFRGIFQQIEQIRRVKGLGVSRIAELLDSVDCLSHWQQPYGTPPNVDRLLE